MISDIQKATIGAPLLRERHLSSPGSKSSACSESEGVNVGDPCDSQKDRVSTTKRNSKKVEKVTGKSDWA